MTSDDTITVTVTLKRDHAAQVAFALAYARVAGVAATDEVHGVEEIFRVAAFNENTTTIGEVA